MSLVERCDDKSDFLARRGGWMLVIWGVVLVILACVFASSTAVASIFAFTGAASVVLGILAARFEGDFELSATGLKGKLIAVAVREDLTLEDKGDRWSASSNGRLMFSLSQRPHRHCPRPVRQAR